MQARKIATLLGLLFFIMAPSAHASWSFFDHYRIDDDEVVNFYPTHAYFEDGRWVLTIEGRIFEPTNDQFLIDTVIGGFELIFDDEVSDPNEFWFRIHEMAADNESRERVKIRLGSRTYTLPRSNDGGRISGKIYLSQAEVNRLDIDALGWTSYYATSIDDRSFEGRVRLIEPYGLSVISDIDDTVKISEVFEGNTTLIRNTFNKPAIATPGMVDFYSSMAAEGATFHYLSGSPWQIYNFLYEFILESGLPEGTMRLKEFQINPTSSALWSFVESGSTVPHKQSYIQTLMSDYPERDFILIGDSGEHDPAIYAWANEQFPGQVKEVLIRHVPSKEHGWQSQEEIAALFGDDSDMVHFIDMETGEIQ